MVNAKHAVLVAVERDGLAPGVDIGAGGMKIGKGRLALDKLQMHQPAGRIVDKYQQGALRPPVLEPPMLAAIDLHQFADTLAPRPRLVDAFCAACDRATARLRSSTGAVSHGQARSHDLRATSRPPT